MAFPTTTFPTGKAPPDEARRRLDRLRAALDPFPRRQLVPDPFVRPNPVRISFPSMPGRCPTPLPVDGSSCHDAVVRLAGRLHDSLGVIKLREMTDPATGEAFLGANYPNGYEYEVEAVIGTNTEKMMVKCPGVPEVEHYSEVPWSTELWDRLFDVHQLELYAMCSTGYFNPHPGMLRVSLEHEAALVSDPPTAEIPATLQQIFSEALRTGIEKLPLAKETPIERLIAEWGVDFEAAYRPNLKWNGLNGHRDLPPTGKGSEAEPAPADDPFADLKAFARTDLKGQERAVIDALCDASGELPIADLAVMGGVGWHDANKGFESAQRRLNPKLKKQGWKLKRQSNAAHLREMPLSDPRKTR